jgi:glycosyltransferase involved in cell wall biosynthesis
MALVSVVIPTFNRAWGLRRALESALAQTHPDCEVIVADDASTDETREVVREFVDVSLIYRRQASRAGMVGNWAKGLELASGDFLVFLADDDRIGPGFVEARLSTFARGDPVACFSNYEVRNPNGRLVRCGGHPHETATELQGPDLFQAALSREWFVGTTLYRTDAVREVWPRICNDDLVLDLGLNLRLALAGGEAVAIPRNDFELGEHPGQNSKARQMEVFEQTDRLLRALLAEGLPKRCERLAGRELASWHTVWGRNLAKDGMLWEARAHFAQAVRTSPRSAWPWKQLVKSMVLPGRLQDAGGEEVQLQR